MKSCLLVGGAGNPNFGDEAIMQVWVKNYLSILPEGKVICDAWGGDLKLCIDRMNVKNTDIASDTQSIFKTTQYFTIADDHIVINDVNQYKISIQLISKSLKEEGAQCIHLYGGGYINSMWPQTYILILSSLLVASEMGIPVFASGLGLLPFKSTYLFFLKLFDYFSLCDVRDQESFDLLMLHNEKGGTYTGDDVLLAFEGEDNYLIQEEKEPSLVVCLQNDLFHGDSLLPLILTKEFLSIFVEKGIKSFKFISAMHPDSRIEDESIIEKINSYGMSVSHTDSFTLIEQGIPVHKDSFFITSRYHVHLIASLWGCKGIALSNNEYYDIKHASVKAMGSCWDVMSLKDALDFFKNTRQVKKKMEMAFTNNQERRDSFINKKAQLLKMVKQRLDSNNTEYTNLDMKSDLIKLLGA